MKKEFNEEDIIVFEGKEFTYNEFTQVLYERRIFKEQLEHMKVLAVGGDLK